MKQKHNFNPGPGVLPKEAFLRASEAVISYKNTGLSILEISHRSKEFIEVMERTIALTRELLNVPDGYSVLFLQGGASLQFLMAPYNLLREGGKAGYVVTGSWAKKAFQEAAKIGQALKIASSEDKNFSYFPKGYDIPKDIDYLHITSNNTIFGTQCKRFPESPVPVVCDMSSDIFSRRIDISKFGLIYAGVQKNMGPAGATMIIVKDGLLGKTGRNIPSMLNYALHLEKESMYNTPPVFSIYVTMLTLEWLKNSGGIEVIEKINSEKASVLYEEINRNALFSGTAAEEDRSTMNATFVLKDESLAEEFNQSWQNNGIVGLKGHRSVGGYRASLYNALPLESVEVLTKTMQEFARKHSKVLETN